ncbi:MAG: NADH-quinone oxidoreductase subunit L [Bacteroidia bacterium]|nr:NADH-quinone oxidoreductase subunit L [Bacteroidia bacterium]
MNNLIVLIPLLPLLGFIINGIGNKKLSNGVISTIASGAIFGSFVISVVLFFTLRHSFEQAPIVVHLFNWIDFGNFHVPMAFQLDALSSLMLLIITGVGFLIHIFSTGYMSHETDFARYFAYLNLFCFSMLMLVLANNFLVMFIGWEGVGLCSYLLIGFWFTNKEYTAAARKAFVMNRIGDLAFIGALFMMYQNFGSLEYEQVFKVARTFSVDSHTMTIITVLLFIGATGKSAQIPLYTWLPDAMAGPTPVSALIHAATMVTAGIFMIVRSHVLFNLAPWTMDLIAVVGVLTAIVAAAIAITQNDIKKVLAYSTVSQLGFMFLALGLGAYSAAMFHVMTHAFFKALLFLGSGSVIHACSGNQDIRTMGGLKKHMPITHATFLVGCLAIAGIPFFSGFFSKDEILAFAFDQQPILWIVAAITAGLTAFYMFRLYFLTFRGTFRGTHEQEYHLHESPVSMTVPLIILAILASLAGFLGLPHVMGHNILEHFLSVNGNVLNLSSGAEVALMVVSVSIATIGIFIAYYLYVKRSMVPEADATPKAMTYRWSQNKFYVDELYDYLILKPIHFISKIMYSGIELLGIDALVNGSGNMVTGTGNTIKYLQYGKTSYYLFAMIIFIVVILFSLFI